MVQTESESASYLHDRKLKFHVLNSHQMLTKTKGHISVRSWDELDIIDDVIQSETVHVYIIGDDVMI